MPNVYVGIWNGMSNKERMKNDKGKKKKERKEKKACGVALNFAQTVLAQF